MNPNCTSCALRLFNDKGYNLHGEGCNYLGNFLIISNLDNNAYKNKSIEFSEQMRIINDICISSTGGCKITELCYLTPLIKCREIGCGADETAIKNCIKNLAEEFKQYRPQRVMITGNAVSRFLVCEIKENLDTIWVSKNNIQYFVNYSPLVKYYDTDKFEIFKQHLIKWIYSIKTNDFSQYEIKYI